MKAVTMPGWQKAVAVFTLAATAVFAAGVYVMDAYGARLISGLETAVGEVVVSEARRLAGAGDLDGAYAKYKDALSGPFDDERQRDWVRREFIRYLLSEGAHERAAAEAAVSPDRKLFVEACEALAAAEQWDLLRQTGEERAAWAHAKGYRRDMALGRFWEGKGWQGLDRPGQATEAYLKSWDIDQSKAVAVAVAPYLSEHGHADQAMEMLRFAAGQGEGE